MLTSCAITGLVISSSPCFPSLICKDSIIHPFFSVSLGEVNKLGNRISYLGEKEGKKLSSSLTKEEALLLSFFPLSYLGKIYLRKQGAAVPSEIILEQEGKLYGTAMVALRLCKLLETLDEKKLNNLKADIPQIIPSELVSVRALRELLEDIESRIMVMRVCLSTSDKIQVQVNARALKTESTYLSSYFSLITEAEHADTLVEAAESYPELFPLGNETYKWIISTGSKTPEKLATQEWAEKLNFLQNNLVEILDFKGADAVRSTALIKFFNKLMENVNAAHQLINKNLYNITDSLSATTTYSKKGIMVTMLSVEDTDDLELSSEEVTQKVKEISEKHNSEKDKVNMVIGGMGVNNNPAALRLQQLLAKRATK